MKDEELARERDTTRKVFAVTRGELATPIPSGECEEALRRADQALSRDDFVSAFDALEAVGDGAAASLAFWERLLSAAHRLGFSDEASRRQAEVIRRVREGRRHGWQLPPSLGAQDDNVYVFPWPGRDEAFVLFDIEDLGAAGPAAGSLSLLRGREHPEVVWKSGPFVTFLDEYWLGASNSVSFSRSGGFAFARPYLRGRFQSSFLILVRASDGSCALIETAFTVYGVEDLEAGAVRVHPTPDVKVPAQFDGQLQSQKGIPPRLFRSGDMEWFDAARLRNQVSQVQSRAR